MPPMPLPLLLVLATLLPLLWGWLVHWLLKRLWPMTPASAVIAPPAETLESPPIDFQI